MRRTRKTSRDPVDATWPAGGQRENVLTELLTLRSVAVVGGAVLGVAGRRGALGVINFASTVFGRSLNRAVVTVCVGVAGSVLAALGILNYFTGFLTLLGVSFPPIAGIMVAEYYIVKRWRGDLAAAGNALPETEPTWVPATLVVWLASALIGDLVPFGIGALNALIASIVLYVLAGWAGLVRPVGTKPVVPHAPEHLVKT